MLRRHRRERLDDAERGKAVPAAPRRRTVDRMIEEAVRALKSASVRRKQRCGLVDVSGADRIDDAMNMSSVHPWPYSAIPSGFTARGQSRRFIRKPRRSLVAAIRFRQVGEHHRASHRGQLDSVPEHLPFVRQPRPQLIQHPLPQRRIAADDAEPQRVYPRDGWDVADARRFRITGREHARNIERRTPDPRGERFVRWRSPSRFGQHVPGGPQSCR